MRGAYKRHEETSSDLDWRPDTESYPLGIKMITEKEKSLFAVLKAGLNYDVELIVSSGFRWFKNCYSLYNVKASDESVIADVKAAEEFLKSR